MNLTTLAYLTQFGRVFPLAKNSKKPMKDWQWQSSNTDDLEIMDEWLKKFPTANWALVPVRAFVVDVDTKDGAQGPQSIEAAGGLGEAFTVRTPSGGRHYYFAPDRPFVTRNNWLPGVDLRYGDDGYVVLPYSIVDGNRYEIETDLDDLAYGRPLDEPSASLLTAIPEWIKTKLDQEPVTIKTPNSLPPVEYECDNDWSHIRPQVKFMFFRNKKNGRIWNHETVKSMKDRTQSGFENELAIRLMNVGAADEEVAIAYRVWCGKHNLKRKDRFYRHIIPSARAWTASYVSEWQAKQPVRKSQSKPVRPRGTTTSL